MTIPLQIEVPDTGEHTIMVVVTERPANPHLPDQHANLWRSVYEVDTQKQTAIRIK